MMTHPSVKFYEILRTMVSFWKRTYGAQDTTVVCLEVQQRWLYVSLRKKLMQQWAALKSNDAALFAPDHRGRHYELCDGIV